MLTINQFAKKYKLSRSALYYDDKVGLISPSARSRATIGNMLTMTLKKWIKSRAIKK